jgi:hypothetical protein
MKEYRTRKPRVTFLPGGEVIISGMHRCDFNDILTEASLAVFDGTKRCEAKFAAGERTDEISHQINMAWWGKLRWMIDCLSEGYRNDQLGKYPREPLTLKEQLKENKRFRDMIDEIIAMPLTN